MDYEIEWCERRLLQRIHRLTIGNLRKQIEPARPPSICSGCSPGSTSHRNRNSAGSRACCRCFRSSKDLSPCAEWEQSLLAHRVTGYDPRWLDQLCLSGTVGWGRVSPHPAWSAAEGGAPRRVVPTGMSPITFYIRETALWLDAVLENHSVDEAKLRQSLSQEAQQIRTPAGRSWRPFRGRTAANHGVDHRAGRARAVGVDGRRSGRSGWI